MSRPWILDRPAHPCAGARDGTICPSRQIVSTVARPTLAC